MTELEKRIYYACRRLMSPPPRYRTHDILVTFTVRNLAGEHFEDVRQRIEAIASGYARKSIPSSAMSLDAASVIDEQKLHMVFFGRPRYWWERKDWYAWESVRVRR